MTQEMLDKIMNKGGKFTSLVWCKSCKTYKGVEDIIEKETAATSVRIGCSYDNLSAVKEGRENGELPSENAGLKGFEWVQYPYILRSVKTGKEYVRVETCATSQFASKFFANGVETAKAELLDKLTAAEKGSGEMPTVMNIALDSIIEVR